MTSTDPRTPEPDNAQPSARRQFWLRGPGIILIIAAAALAIVGVVAAFSGGASRPQAEASSFYVDPCGGGPCPTAAPTPEPTVEETTPGLGPWTPCNVDAPGVLTGDPTTEDGCADLMDDACDGAYVASKEGKGPLLDTLIENEIMIDANRLKDCPQFLGAWKTAKAGFGEGDLEVGKDVKPGRYVTTANLSGGTVSDCYWERAGKNGHTIANDFVIAAKKITVTIRKTDEMFTSQGCGDWIPAS